MKLSPTPARHQAGSALLLTVVLVGLVGFLIIAYLGLVQNQNSVTVRSQAWNAAIPVLEAGIEDALVHINLHGATNLACDGWTQSGNTYTMQRDLGENFYSVSITNWVSGASNNAPIIESKGYVVAPLLTAAPAPGFLAAVASPNPTVALGTDGTWALVLEERSDGTTRLIARVRGRGKPGWLFRAVGPFLTDPGHVLMQRKQLYGIKRRAEAAAGAGRSGTSAG